MDEALKEVLCIPGKRRNYAVEFPYVEEICKDVMISLMPCLPEHFAGVCNYKGRQVRWSARKALSPEEEADARQMVLVLRHQRYYLGILCIRNLI